MTQPDFSRGYLRIPLAVWLAVYCQSPLTRRQTQLVSVVIRETWGWQSPGGTVRAWSRPLPTPQFAGVTGLATDHIARDLGELVASGVLRRQDRRYQFEPDARLWKTSPPATPNWRRTPLEQPVSTAKSAPGAPVVKTRKIEERNVVPPTWTELSPGGDNAPASARSVAVRLPFADAPSAIGNTPADRFVAVVAAFAGSLTAGQTAALRTWISDVGIAKVWRTLEPALSRGGEAVQPALATHLALYERFLDPTPTNTWDA